MARFPTTAEVLLILAKSIRENLKNSPAFSSLPALLAGFDGDVDAFDAAIVKARSRSLVDIADREARALVVWQHIGHIVDFVQSVADAQTSAADAIAVIKSAGLEVRKRAVSKKAELAARYTGISGQVLLDARAIPRAGAYFWEMSVDQLVWSEVSETRKGRTTLSGLTRGQTVYFRFCALTDQGRTEYSQVVSLIVH